MRNMNMQTALFLINSRKNLKSFISKSINLLETYTNDKLINNGKAFHCHLIKTGLSSEKYIALKLFLMYLDSRKSFEIDQMLKEFDGFNLTVHNCLISANLQWGNVIDACKLFDEMPERNEVTWSAMIARFSQSGDVEEAVRLFREMVYEGFKPNIYSYSSVISALAGLEALQAGRNIHARVIKIGMEINVFVSNSLVNFYCKCGNTKDGRLVFDSLPDKNVVSWNTMVCGYSSNGQLAEATEVFVRIPKKNNILWNSLLTGHLGNKDFGKVFEVFNAMISYGEQPNKWTFLSVLKACGGLASLEKGKHAHTKALKLAFHHDIFVATALLDMYAKSGSIESSRKIFNRMPTKNKVVWTAMIQGLAENGFADESLRLFEEMEKTSSIAPTETTLLSVLFACSHSGLVDKGLGYFNSMEKVYGIRPKERHYTSVVDMLSRSGRLGEAEKFILSMPCEPGAKTWAALLGGCKTYGDERLAERTARKLSEAAETKAGDYVILSHVFALGGRWNDMTNTRNLMDLKGIKKNGGCSWIELRNQVHLFYSHDTTHTQSDEIYWILQLFNSEIQSLH